MCAFVQQKPVWSFGGGNVAAAAKVGKARREPQRGPPGETFSRPLPKTFTWGL